MIRYETSNSLNNDLSLCFIVTSEEWLDAAYWKHWCCHASEQQLKVGVGAESTQSFACSTERWISPDESVPLVKSISVKTVWQKVDEVRSQMTICTAAPRQQGSSSSISSTANSSLCIPKHTSWTSLLTWGYFIMFLDGLCTKTCKAS